MNKKISLIIIVLAILISIPAFRLIHTPIQDQPVFVENFNKIITSDNTAKSINSTSTVPTEKIITPIKKVTPAPINSSPQTLTIIIKGYEFTPTNIKIKKGTTVKWINQDIAKHTVTADNGTFTSDYFGQSQSFSHTFTETGTISYHCEPHPYMKATIIVTE